jgi:hypothetical protein
MTNINLLHVSALGTILQRVFLIKGTQAQLTELGIHT